MSERAQGRLRQILHILKKNQIVRGLTPEKLRLILEDLGPTFIKFGQILSMRPDLIPKDYCKELEKLRSAVVPMPFGIVKDLIEAECGKPLEDVFQKVEEKPLGSASIGQVHKAVLMDGREVVIKIQRPKIKEIMEEDIKLCKKALILLKVVNPVGDAVDFRIVLDEMWESAQHEFDFLQEGMNLKKFADLNREIKYVTCPNVLFEWTTSRMLMMEYIDGIPIDHIEELEANGYDMQEIGDKLAENYVKQILEDAFFQADPHPGNISIRDGKIVWIDMGMMGTLTPRDREIFSRAMEAVVYGDIYELKDAVMAIGEVHGKVDHSALYNDIDYIIRKYASMDFKSLNLGELIQEIQDVLNQHKISIGRGITMLIRGIITIEGVLTDISPNTDFMHIFSSYIKQEEFSTEKLKKELKMTGLNSIHLLRKTVGMPGNLLDLLKMTVKGQTKINMELSESAEFFSHLDEMINRLVLAMIDAALLMASSLICNTDMKGRVFGIPVLGALGYVLAIILGIWLLVDILKGRKKR